MILYQINERENNFLILFNSDNYNKVYNETHWKQFLKKQRWEPV